jgi:hypothetical protein
MLYYYNYNNVYDCNQYFYIGFFLPFEIISIIYLKNALMPLVALGRIVRLNAKQSKHLRLVGYIIDARQAVIPHKSTLFVGNPGAAPYATPLGARIEKGEFLQKRGKNIQSVSG